MDHKFDELTKGLAQSPTRRAALKKFGSGLAGVALAMFGLAKKAEANGPKCLWWCRKSCHDQFPKNPDAYRACLDNCIAGCESGR